MTTIEGNKLIAVFMGWAHHKGYFLNPDNPSQVYKESLFTYQSSWDWQIPVWVKFLSLTRERYYNETKRGSSTEWWDQRDIWEHNYHSAIDSGSPKDGFDILVLAIQWYNENKTK